MIDLPLVDTPDGKILERRKDCIHCFALERRLIEVEGAFPDGPVKHFEYHQAKINAAKEEAEFWKTAKVELTKAGVSTLVSVIKTVLVLALVGLMYKLGLGAVAAALVK